VSVIAAGEDLLDKAHAVAAGIVGRVRRTVAQDEPALLAALDRSSAGCEKPSPICSLDFPDL
jgi:hypothetical protein